MSNVRMVKSAKKTSMAGSIVAFKMRASSLQGHLNAALHSFFLYLHILHPCQVSLDRPMCLSVFPAHVQDHEFEYTNYPKFPKLPILLYTNSISQFVYYISFIRHFFSIPMFRILSRWDSAASCDIFRFSRD